MKTQIKPYLHKDDRRANLHNLVEHDKDFVFMILCLGAIDIHLLDSRYGEIVSFQSDRISFGSELRGIVIDLIWESSGEKKDLIESRQHPTCVLVMSNSSINESRRNILSNSHALLAKTLLV